MLCIALEFPLEYYAVMSCEKASHYSVKLQIVDNSPLCPHTSINYSCCIHMHTQNFHASNSNVFSQNFEFNEDKFLKQCNNIRKFLTRNYSNCENKIFLFFTNRNDESLKLFPQNI